MKIAIAIVLAVSLKQKALAFATVSAPRNSASKSSLYEPRHFKERSGGFVRLEDSSATVKSGSTASPNTNALSPATVLLASSSSTSPTSSRINSSYYLLWSPGFFRKFAIAGAALWGMHLLQWDTRLASVLSQQWKATKLAGAAQNLMLPLLSSSCCLLQLLINVIAGAGGCAGFNTILGPVRPIFLALLVGSNAVTGASMKQLLWRYSLALMPEGVHLWNELAKRRWHNRVLREEARRQNSIVDGSDGEASAPKPRLRATISVDIPTMGCVTCINKIESSLRECAPNQVVEANSWLEKDKNGGSARLDVFADSKEDLQALSKTIVKSIDDAGFHGSVVTDLEILPEQQ